MLCEKCKQNTATVHYQQNINGQMSEYHLCEKCAHEMNLSPSFDNMFKGFLSGFSNPLSVGSSASHALTCPECGFTFNDIQSSGRLGCAQCYSTFSKHMDSILKNIQGNCRHTGKFPQKAGAELRVERELESLRFKLKKAIEDEEYEKAATLRDKIRELEGGEGK